ncbi:DNA replication protein [Zamilon virus]|uniref:DNA replication protein n=1 Tax=Zamilon virus TaxID=1411887 RepID=V6BPG7_9VIRU|nr:DNA replication protein [Zamilon virus]CDI70052.1 DNA replication protein [Zamilon virus]
MSKTQKKVTKKIEKKVVKPVIKLTETISMKNLKRLLSAEDLDEDIQRQLSAYYKKVFKTKREEGDEIGYVKVKYYYSDKLEDTGRVYAEKGQSLQSFKKSIRGFINNGINTDIDMKNSHPTLITQYCKKKDILCPYLVDYVNRREKILEDISSFHKISRDKAKELILKLCYLGSYKLTNDNGESYTPTKKLKFLTKFKEEAEYIAEKVAKKETSLYEKIKDNNDCKNKLAVVLSILAQRLEHKCLMAMYDYFTSKKIKVSTLCFDGMLINSFDEDIKVLLKGCEKYVYDKTEYKINLEEKPMNYELDFEVPDHSIYVSSDCDCQEKLFELEGAEKFKFCNKKLYIFDENTGMFDDNNHILFRYLRKHQMYLNVIISTDKNGVHKTKNYGTDHTLREKVVGFVKDVSEDNNWLKRTAKSSLGYLLFKDGIYNFKTGTFTEGFDPKIVFKCGVPYKFPKYDKDLVKKAYRLSFKKLFDNPKPMITALACALAGDIKLKKMYFCPGRSNAGKSYLIMMLQYCFGGYIGDFNGANLLYQKNDSRDEAAKFRWAYKLAHTRILMSNEMPMKGSVLDGIMIKRLASGGDNIVGREHQESEESFKPNFTVFCMFNDVPNIEPFDQAVMNRLVYNEFPYVFVDEEDVDKKPYYKLKDNNIESKFETKDFMKGFIHLFLDAYQDYLKNGMPEFDPEVKEKWTAETKQNDIVIETIKEHYEITGKDNDKVPVSDMKKFKNSHKEFKDISLNRFNDILRDELKLVEGRSTFRFWKGIKKIDILADIEVD